MLHYILSFNNKVKNSSIITLEYITIYVVQILCNLG